MAKKPAWKLAKATGVRMTAHANGQWCKKIAGKLHYFGPWEDPEGAVARYRKHSDDLHKGLDAPTSPSSGEITIEGLANAYLAHRESDVITTRERTEGRHDTAIGPAQFNRYRRAGQHVMDAIGKQTDADTLRPAHWMKVKAHLVRRYQPVTLAGIITDIKTIWTWGHNSEHLTNPPKFGDDFQIKNRKRVMRRNKRVNAGKMLDAETIRKLLEVAAPHVATMTLLGINCGFYSVDCADLVQEALHLDDEYPFLDFARFKTDVDRLCPLWPETVAGIKHSIKHRPDPDSEEHRNRVFITKRGKTWANPQSVRRDAKGRLITPAHNDYLRQEFARLFDKAGITRERGCGFSWLRHVFYTVSTRTRDTVSRNLIMGHTEPGMSEHYNEEHDLEPVRAVTDYVRDWLEVDKVKLPFEVPAEREDDAE